jgi:nitrogen regulatory protein P-II 1
MAALKRIEAIIRPEKLETLRDYLQGVGYPGMMITEIEGHGKQRGVEQQWRGAKYKTYFLPKVKVELVVDAKALNKTVKAIIDVCCTDMVGDGKIFVSDVKDVIRIRTGEKGLKAVG